MEVPAHVLAAAPNALVLEHMDWRLIAQRVRGRYSRLARNGSRSQNFYGRRDRLRGLAAYSLGMSGTVNSSAMRRRTQVCLLLGLSATCVAAS